MTNSLLSAELIRAYATKQLHQYLTHPLFVRRRARWKAEWEAKPRAERARILREARASARREKLARAEYERISGNDFPECDC